MDKGGAMRYREGQEIPDNIQPHIGDASMVFSAVFGLLIGIVLLVLARKGRQIWLLTWSSGLTLVGITYLAYLAIK